MVADQIQYITDSGTIYTFSESIFLKNVTFDKHLYRPLLVLKDNEISMTPASLNKGEMEFIEDLKNYWSANECTFMKMFVLRNLARGNGIGFFDLDTFYPDFILWLEYEKKQIISFIDPKGLIFIGDLNHPKLNLYKFLQQDIAKKLNDPTISLNAFIISNTPFDMFRSRYSYLERFNLEELERRHILFQYTRDGIKNLNYVDRMFDMLHSDSHSAM